MTSLLLRSSRTQASAAVASAAASLLLVVSKVSETEEEGADEKKKLVSTTRLFASPMDICCQCESALVRRSRTMHRMDLATHKSRTFDSCYDIDKSAQPLGEGGFGFVHLAKDRATGEKVAVKTIPKSMTDVESFQREINALLRIRSSGGHPHICALRDSFDEGLNYMLVLDYISGGEMFDHLIRSGAYSEADAARLVREVASALAFLHGIGVVHADLKPENIMLSTAKSTDAVVKLVDFGCAEALWEDDDEDDYIPGGAQAATPDSNAGGENRALGLTAAYSPPEALLNPRRALEPSIDMWSLGVILYIMLTGRHPFDLEGDGTDDDIAERILDGEYPLHDSRITKHMSESAISLIEQLMDPDPKTRLTADAMLEHPWVRGETATTDIIKGSDKRLGRFRVFKSKLQAKFFQDVVEWSDEDIDETKRKTSLIERSFRSLDEKGQGFLTPHDLGQKTGVNTVEGGGESLNMSAFDNLLSENMKHKYFPKGHVIYKEGDIGNHMYMINSGSIVVSTSDGSRAIRGSGDFFGEGALLHPKKIRSATISCKTPVHAMEISREYFEKYLASSESGLMITLREKDKIRKRNRAKTILRLQNNLKERKFKKGDRLFDVGEDGDSLFLVEKGKVDVVVGGKTVFSATPGNLCGENSLLTGRRRNCTAVCASDEGCLAEQMMGRDFRKLMDLSPELKVSLRDIALRRDFKKAVVFRLKKEFPYDNPREAFDATKKAGNKGDLSVEEIGDLLREMDPDYTDEEIMEIINTMNLTKSGSVSFDEFKKVFIANIRTSASM